MMKFIQWMNHLLQDNASTSSKKKSQIMPYLRLSVAFLCILLCALSRNAFFVVMVFAVEFLRLSFKPAEEIGKILKKMVLPVIFTGILLLPAVFMGTPKTMLTVTLKVAESLLVLFILNSEMEWREITEALRIYHLPAVFIFTLDMTMRFLLLLGRLSEQIMEAVLLRSVGKTGWKEQRTGGVLGITFLKSQKMAEKTAEAMECRCFQGEYRRMTKRKWSKKDSVYALLLPILMVAFFYTQNLMR